MRMFVTGATGHIGTLVVAALQRGGHDVLGLARSQASEQALRAVGADARRGDLDDLDGLAAAAAEADGVVHLAFGHGTDAASAAEVDLAVVGAIGGALRGSGKPFVMTSGTAGLPPGRVGAESDTFDPDGPGAGRGRSENAAIALADDGVRSSAVRLAPTVHGPDDVHGFIVRLIDAARQTGFAAYIGDGANRWAAVHELDAADLFVRALQDAPPGTRLHGVGDEGVAFRSIAEAIARGLGLETRSIPAADADAQFGFLGTLAGLDLPASSEATQALLDWRPTHPGLLADLEEGRYFSR